MFVNFSSADHEMLLNKFLESLLGDNKFNNDEY
jgi:hypothetical protein